MTAIPQRRTRATVIGLSASLVGLLAVVGLGAAGMQTLADSTAGQQAGETDQPVVAERLPFTSTALIGVADDDGRLTSLAVGVLESDGTGGSIVQLPVAADPSSGNDAELSPIDAVLTVAGPIAFRESVERLTGLSFDVIEIADPERFAQLVTPLGDMEVDLPGAVRDASSDEIWEAGPQVLTAPGAARLITATDPDVPAGSYEIVGSIVWAAIADRVGAGIGSASPVAVDTELPLPGSMDEFFARLFAGPVTFRALQHRAVDEDEIDERLGVPYRDAFGPDVPMTVALVDRAEMLMVFGGIAPTRLGAPLDSPTFRVVNQLTADDTAPLGLTPSDVTKTVVNVLMFSQVNVVSVVESPDGSAPDVTRLAVADRSLLGQLEAIYGPPFGQIEIVPTDVAIEGIDVEVVLGRSILDRLAADLPTDVAGSAEENSEDATVGGATGDDATDD